MHRGGCGSDIHYTASDEISRERAHPNKLSYTAISYPPCRVKVRILSSKPSLPRLRKHLVFFCTVHASELGKYVVGSKGVSFPRGWLVEVGANDGKENGRINISSRELSERAYIRYYMYVVQKPDKRGTGGWELARATLDSRGKLVSLAAKKVFRVTCRKTTSHFKSAFSCATLCSCRLGMYL